MFGLGSSGSVAGGAGWGCGAGHAASTGTMTSGAGYSPLDNDEGHYWCAATARWDSAADFGSPGYENQFCWPTASADYDPTASLETCDVIQLDGSGSAAQRRGGPAAAGGARGPAGRRGVCVCTHSLRPADLRTRL